MALLTILMLAWSWSQVEERWRFLYEPHPELD